MPDLKEFLISEIETIRAAYWNKMGWGYTPYPDWIEELRVQRPLRWLLTEFAAVQVLID